jgi:hypothetical protein
MRDKPIKLLATAADETADPLERTAPGPDATRLGGQVAKADPSPESRCWH